MELCALAGRHACASMLVPFCLIPQVTTSTYLRPCTLLLTFLLTCRACPPSLMFFLARGRKGRKRRKTRCLDWRKKDIDGPRTHCDNMTHSPRCFNRVLTSCHKVVFLPTSKSARAVCSFVCLFLRWERQGNSEVESLSINVSDSPMGKQAPNPAGVKSHQPWVLNWWLNYEKKIHTFKVYSNHLGCTAQRHTTWS